MSTHTLVDEALPVAPKRQVWAWWGWDLGFSPLNSVMISFVFSVYVTGTVAATPAHGQQVWANAQSLSGVLLAVLAPLMGAWVDQVRNSRMFLIGGGLLAIAAVGAGWFVAPHPNYLLLGVSLLATASVIQDVVGVCYNGMLLKISTPKNIGRVSSIGWGAGYLGGVCCLAFVLFGFVLNGGFLHLPKAELVNIRAVALFSAAFMLVCCLPLMIWTPKDTRAPGKGFNPLQAYVDIFRHIGQMFTHNRKLLHFLIASAIFRDGLTAVFGFGGVIASTSYGFSTSDVVMFGLAANVIALLGTWGLSWLDDKIGPRLVIIGCLTTMIAAGIVVITWHTKLSFWICGLLISSLVGLVQSASRTFLARIAPADEENEIFGLYATVGRAASPLAPTLIAVFTAALGARWGILGIVATLALGLAVFLPLRIVGVTHERTA